MKPRILICELNTFKTAQGIHLNCPDQWYLERAVETAEKDGFLVIYAHYETNGRNYKINFGAMHTLLRLAQIYQIPVDIADPAAGGSNE